MGTFLHLYETEEQLNEIYNGSGYTEPWVSYTKEITKVHYNKKPEPIVEPNYLTFEIIGDGNISIISDNLEFNRGSGWETVPGPPFILLVRAGDIVKFRAPIGSPNTQAQSCFTNSSCVFNLKGNVMSLLDGENFESMTELTGDYNFYELFRGCTGLTDASEVILPATTLASYCYRSMFYGCTSLIKAPELPATTLANNCYNWMFSDCTSLTTAPSILPATTLANNCYRSMFQGCKSLTTAPELPAITLVSGCYMSMYQNCTQLSYIKCLATDISGSLCTNSWVQGVSSTGTFVKSPEMSSWPTNNNGIPYGWEVQDA